MELKGTKITVKEINGLSVLEIETDKDIVKVNSKEVWRKILNNPISYIPNFLKEFVMKHLDEIDFTRKKEKVYADCYHNKLSVVASFYFSVSNSSSTVIFDYLTDLENFRIEHLEELENGEKTYKKLAEIDSKLKVLIAKNGFSFEHSHVLENFNSSWVLSFNENNWNENVFLEIWTLISESYSIVKKAMEWTF